jgi:hypothetical protein
VIAFHLPQTGIAHDRERHHEVRLHIASSHRIVPWFNRRKAENAFTPVPARMSCPPGAIVNTPLNAPLLATSEPPTVCTVPVVVSVAPWIIR